MTYAILVSNSWRARGGNKNSQSNPVRITAELRNVSSNPCQEEPFWWIPKPPALRLNQSRVRSHECLLSIGVILTVVQADIGSSSGKRFFSSEPTESVYAVIEAYVDHRFTELDRTLDESAAIVRGCVTEGKPSTVDPLRINSWRISGYHSGFHSDLRGQPGVCFVP